MELGLLVLILSQKADNSLLVLFLLLGLIISFKNLTTNVFPLGQLSKAFDRFFIQLVILSLIKFILLQVLNIEIFIKHFQVFPKDLDLLYFFSVFLSLDDIFLGKENGVIDSITLDGYVPHGKVDEVPMLLSDKYQALLHDRNKTVLTFLAFLYVIHK